MLQRSSVFAPLTAALAAAAFLAPALARDRATPDWPCIQRKIDNLTSTQVWNGPAVEELTGWHETAIEQLVAKLVDRRTPIKDAEAALEQFAASLSQPSRGERLTLVFAGVFQTLHHARAEVMKGLERHLRAQRARALEIERQGTEVAALEEQSETGGEMPVALEEARARFDWAQRIFDERQNSIPLACEVPVRIDQRIFTLGKAIDVLISDAAAATAPVAQSPPASHRP